MCFVVAVKDFDGVGLECNNDMLNSISEPNTLALLNSPLIQDRFFAVKMFFTSQAFATHQSAAENTHTFTYAHKPL